MRSLLVALSERADIVILDTAPILSVSDAVPLLETVSGTVIVAKVGATTPRRAPAHAPGDRGGWAATCWASSPRAQPERASTATARTTTPRTESGKAPEPSVDGVGPTALAARLERWEQGREARERAGGGLGSQPERPD